MNIDPDNILVCMTTYNRIDCARINQEVIKYNYPFPLTIVHACSDPKYNGYIEDILIKSEPLPLRLGALQLLKDSLKAATEEFNPSYIIHIEGDTWLLDENIILNLINQMSKNENILLCASSWENLDPTTLPFDKKDLFSSLQLLKGKISRILGLNKNKMFDFATQFFIIKNHKPLIDALASITPNEDILLEKLFFNTFMSIANIENVLRLTAREPALPKYRWTCPPIELYSQHWPSKETLEKEYNNYNNIQGKKEVLLTHRNIRSGYYIEKLIKSNNYDYYNPGCRRY